MEWDVMEWSRAERSGTEWYVAGWGPGEWAWIGSGAVSLRKLRLYQ